MNDWREGGGERGGGREGGITVVVSTIPPLSRHSDCALKLEGGGSDMTVVYPREATTSGFPYPFGLDPVSVVT